MSHIKNMLSSKKAPVFIIIVLLLATISMSASAQTQTKIGYVSTTTPNAPQSYHYTWSMGWDVYNLFNKKLYTMMRTASWNIPKENNKIASSNLVGSYSSGVASTWGQRASKQHKYYSVNNEHIWAGGDVTGWGVNVKADVSFKAGTKSTPAAAEAGVNISASATIGEVKTYISMANIQKGTSAKSSYLNMRYSNY